MRKLFLVLAFLMLSNIAAGFTPLVNQDSSSSSKSVHNGEEYTKIIRGNFDLGVDALSLTQDDMNSKVRSFLSKNIPRFEIDPENLALSSSYIAQKSKDLSILKYTQEYDGLPVYSSRVIVAVQDGKVVTLKSEYHPKIDMSTKPTLSEADILEAVEKDMAVPVKLNNNTKKNIAEKSSSVEDVLLVIYPEHIGTGIEYHLAYKIELGLIKSPPAKWTYIVDANNGEILEKYDRVVYSTLDGKVTGSVYPENINQTPVTKNFSNMTLYDYTTPETDVFWSGTGDDIDNSITTKNPINLSGVSSATLEFKIKYSIETDFDFGYASISTDGINYSIYETYTGIISNWTAREIDLSDFAGQQIWIRFNYSTDQAVQYDGIYIDDIKIETNTGTKFNDTGNSFANWDNVGFSIATQNLGSYALGNTSSNGSYSFSGLPGSFVLRYEFIGPYVHVNNYSGNDQYLNIDISTPAMQNIDWGTYDTSYNKEESNVFYHVNRAHDFFIKGSPFDISSMNYQTTAYVQYTGTCNAFSDGTNVYFFGKGGGCEATSLYSDIIYHEYTHSVVDHVYTTNLPYREESGALNEGWADYFATAINGNPCMDNFMGSGCFRNLTDIYRYPEDIMGEVHGDSRIVAGASWDLKQALGADITDALVINAMKLEPFNFSEYLDDIIVADDTNGNLADGTPHLFDICTAFYQKHGIYSTQCYIYYPVEPAVNLIENPGFESGLVNWTNYSSNGHKIITNGYSNSTHQGSWFAYMGNYNNANDYIYQDITIPSNANEAYVRFWYWISSTEKTTTIAYDQMKIEIRRPDNNTLLKDLGNLSNLNESYGFVISNRYDVSEFKGQTIRLKFNTTTDSSLGTAFFVDDTALTFVSSPNGTTPISYCTTISSPGSYVLTRSIINSFANTCINITSSNVVFDGAGFAIDGINALNTNGVYVYNSTTVITNVTVQNLKVMDWGGYGIILTGSNNTIYNNIFNNTNNFNFYGTNINTWNTTRQSGTNIINGSYLGGNFWANPDGAGFSQTCTDGNGDGICDSSYTLDSYNIDYLPLKLTPALVFAITPNSRNAQVGTPVTLFLSVINYGTATATGVSIVQASSLPATVSYQQWNSTAFTGSANTPVDMPADSTANFVITINATSAFDSSSMTFNVSGTNVAAALISAVNTLTNSASVTPSADVIMMSTSLNVSTVVNTPTVFAVATSNVGGASATDANLILDIPSTITGMVYQLNETYPANGTIKGPATGLTIGIGAQPTFAVFLIPTQPIAYDPANNRITIKLADGSGKVIGAQSVAVSTT
ncbi:MAG: NosD domain-containing protein [Candidatus Methanoperedens sp.]